MGLFVYVGRDGPRGAELRKTLRPRHLAHLEPLDAAGRIRFAGPLLEQGAVRGSLVVFEAEDEGAAREIAEGDPYAKEGVFAEVSLHETRAVFPK